MIIEEQKKIAHIISDALVADENRAFDSVDSLYDERNMYDSHNIMRLVLLYYKVKTGQIEKKDAVFEQVRILEDLTTYEIIEHVDKEEILSEVARQFKGLPDRDSMIHIIRRVIDIANTSYTRGYEEGRKEVQHID